MSSRQLDKRVFLKRLPAGTAFGELALSHDNMERTASIQTLTNCVFATVTYEDFRKHLEYVKAYNLDE